MFSIYAGDTKDIEFTISEEGQKVDLTSASIQWLMKKGEVTITKTNTNGITLTDATNGVFTVKLTNADTKGLSGMFTHEAKITDATDNVSTVYVGKFMIK
jgi:diketogulonate reductase-like aldo/keto reductase